MFWKWTQTWLIEKAVGAKSVSASLIISISNFIKWKWVNKSKIASFNDKDKIKKKKKTKKKKKEDLILLPAINYQTISKI